MIPLIDFRLYAPLPNSGNAHTTAAQQQRLQGSQATNPAHVPRSASSRETARSIDTSVQVAQQAALAAQHSAQLGKKLLRTIQSLARPWKANAELGRYPASQAASDILLKAAAAQQAAEAAAAQAQWAADSLAELQASTGAAPSSQFEIEAALGLRAAKQAQAAAARATDKVCMLLQDLRAAIQAARPVAPAATGAGAGVRAGGVVAAAAAGDAAFLQAGVVQYDPTPAPYRWQPQHSTAGLRYQGVPTPAQASPPQKKGPISKLAAKAAAATAKITHKLLALQKPPMKKQQQGAATQPDGKQPAAAAASHTSPEARRRAGKPCLGVGATASSQHKQLADPVSGALLAAEVASNAPARPAPQPGPPATQAEPLADYVNAKPQHQQYQQDPLCQQQHLQKQQQQHQQRLQKQQKQHLQQPQQGNMLHNLIPNAALSTADMTLAELMLQEAAATYAAAATAAVTGNRWFCVRADGLIMLRGADAATVQALVRLHCPGVDRLVQADIAAVPLQPLAFQGDTVLQQKQPHAPRAAVGSLQDSLLLTRAGLKRACEQRAPAELRTQLLRAVDQASNTNTGLRGWLMEAHALFKALWVSDATALLGALGVGQVLVQAVEGRVALAELLIAVHNLLLRGGVC